MKRRDFMGACAAGVAGTGATFGLCTSLIGCTKKSAGDAAMPPGIIQYSGMTHGHHLRNGGASKLPPVSETLRIPVLIVGAGIGGLSAGWQLLRKGFTDFQVLELASAAGGNSRSGHNAVSRFPLGAHYLPLPTEESIFVRELLADLGALAGDPHGKRPIYDELRLCHAPQERLYRNGLWQEGIIPQHGLSPRERDEISRFLDQMNTFKEARDAQGRRAFALPVEYSSPAPRWRDLDRITMADWLRSEGYSTAPLAWYVNYACRDDFGTDVHQTSAWAAIHYFACRNGESANAASDAVLTAPEGNGWIVRALTDKLKTHLHPNAIVFGIEQKTRSVSVDVWLPQENRSIRYLAEHLVWAAPLFVFSRLAINAPAKLLQAAGEGTYAPWLVANLTLADFPHTGPGAPLSWDNVLYDGEGLGYIVATHQDIRVHNGATVLTWYNALSSPAPNLARATLLNTPREVLARRILGELSRPHADLPTLTTSLDICVHGHAMIRPTPGQLWKDGRQTLTNGWNRIQFAHADVSGLSLFEEANYRGVIAAQRILESLRHVASSS